MDTKQLIAALDAAEQVVSADRACALVDADIDALDSAVKAVRAALASDAAGQRQPACYFVYDSENGLETFDTEAQREKAHAEAIEPYLDDGWSEEVENVVSGVITHVTLKNTIAPNPGHTNCACDECNAYREAGGTDEWSEICDYHAAPVAPAAPEGWKLVPIEPTREMRKAGQAHTGAVSATYRDMLAAAPTPTVAADAAAPNWQPIETAPKTRRTLLLGYSNSAGKWRTVRGQWMSADYIAEYWEDPDDVEPGWFETSAAADDVPNCWGIEPTHWMPLPAAPQGAAQ